MLVFILFFSLFYFILFYLIKKKKSKTIQLVIVVAETKNLIYTSERNKNELNQFRDGLGLINIIKYM